jgi:hypothetical protein
MKKWANESNRAFSKEEAQMVKQTNKQTKKPHEEMFNIPDCKGNANQNTLRLHLTLVRMATIKNTKNNKCWRGFGKKRTLICHLWECKLVQQLRKTVWRLLKKLKIELPYDLAIPRNIPKGM